MTYKEYRNAEYCVLFPKILIQKKIDKGVLDWSI